MTRKTRLSALATAFGLTLTLGLALPIMATVTYTFYECTFSVDGFTQNWHPGARTTTSDSQCYAGTNVKTMLRYRISSTPYGEWEYYPYPSDGYNITQIVLSTVTALDAQARGQGRTGIYPFYGDWSGYTGWVY